LGAEGLKFDQISAGITGRVNELLCQIEITVMVDAGLRNDGCLVNHDDFS
jgi:hypothetical protein